MPQNKGPQMTKIGQAGNVFFIILIAVMLFAALAFTFSKGIQQGGQTISQRQAEIASSDILNYAQRVERGVQTILADRVSENDLSFDNHFISGYANTDCVTNACKVFETGGGGVTWQKPPPKANNGEPYAIATNRVGSVDGTTKQVGTTALDLVIILPVKPLVCDTINRQTNGFTTWESSVSLNDSTLFDGDYATPAGARISRGNETAQPTTGCFCIGSSPCETADPHYFYSVIYER